MSSKKKTKKNGKNKTNMVNRKFLTDLANDIYDPKTRRFMRLCAGTLQNGPDPTNTNRLMHCGLGELYFSMTGKQPKIRAVTEDDVVDLVVRLCPLKNSRSSVEFREAISEIPYINDNSACFSKNNYDEYRSRAARVAKQLRKAAALLPEQ